MREQLEQYVNLLFAGTQNTADIRREILQNTLDHYDDLLAQGKSPEAAYRLAISGIGDVSELLSDAAPAPQAAAAPSAPVRNVGSALWQKLLRAAAVFLYIVSPIPLFVLEWVGMEHLGLCGTLGICAVATALLIVAGNPNPSKKAAQKKEEDLSPKAQLKKSVSSVLWALGLAAYFLLSFSTGAWYITWVMFPLCGAVQGLVNAILDLMEANKQ